MLRSLEEFGGLGKQSLGSGTRSDKGWRKRSSRRLDKGGGREAVCKTEPDLGPTLKLTYLTSWGNNTDKCLIHKLPAAAGHIHGSTRSWQAPGITRHTGDRTRKCL